MNGAVPPPPTEGPAPDRDGLSLALRHTEPLRAGSPVTWSLEVRNGGPGPVTLVFTSGQRGDVVLRQGPAERYRWSRDRAFVQVVGEVSLAPGQARSFDLEDRVLAVEPGTYDLVATLSSRPAPPEVTRKVDVVA